MLAALFVPLIAVAQCPAAGVPLVGSNYAKLNDFGESMSVDGDTLIVGAPNEAPGGIAYVFRRSGSIWTEEAQLAPSSPQPSDHFGQSVACQGDRAAVMTPGRDTVTVFARTGTVWSEEQVLTAPAPGAGFGSALQLLGDTLLVGCPLDDTVATDAGAVHVYERGSGVWSLAATLFGSTTSAGHTFGSSLDLDGTTLVVGTPKLQKALVSGRAYVFSGSGSSWTEVQKLAPSAGGPDDEFGDAVAVSGDRLLVGAPELSAGVVFVYERSGGVWSEVDQLQGAPSVTSSEFGAAVDLDGNVALVGSPGLGDSRGVLFRYRGSDWDDGVDLIVTTGFHETGHRVALAGGQAIVADPAGDAGVFPEPATHGLAQGGRLGIDYDNLHAIEGPLQGCAIGPLGKGQLGGLACDPATDTVYATSTATNELLSVDPATGAATALGPLGFDRVEGLAFDSNQRVLWGADSRLDVLVRIDPATGAGTKVGPLGFGFVHGLAFDPGAGVLYGLEMSTQELLAIDTATGAATSIGALSPGSNGVFQSLDFDVLSGELLGYSKGNVSGIYVIDAVTAALTLRYPLTLASSGVATVIELELTESYCTAGTSASGCRALLSAAGTASATAPSGFVLSAAGVEGGHPGLFYFGTLGRQAAPWGNGTSYQCVVPPVTRTGLLPTGGTAGACDGAFAQDLNALWCATCPKPAENPGPGVFVQAQLWYRDPQSTSNQTTSLSNAIEFLVGP